jgi:hypothetical protein
MIMPCDLIFRALGCCCWRPAPPPPTLVLTDGSQGYALNCGGTAMNWGMRMKKAGEVCRGRGYDILARDQRTGQMTLITPQYGSSLPTVDREMIVRCRV